MARALYACGWCERGCFMNKRLSQVAIAFATLLGCAAAWAVDGISVTAHWTGQNLNSHGGYGEIWRHDIVESQVVGHQRLYFNPARPARHPVLSPDGSRVAFLLVDGAVALMSVEGGEATVFQGVQSHGEAALDWPSGEWIYYTQGGHNQPSGSKYLRRVHALAGIDERVTTFLADDGVTQRGSWRFHVAADLQHAVVRADNNPPEPYGRITAVDLVEDGGRLRVDRSVPRFSCATGIDPAGEFFIAGHEDHEGVDVRLWDDLAIVKALRWSEAVAWGPDTRDTGVSHNRNAWSTNSTAWMCIHVGWGNRGELGANQMLINWQDEERIVVTQNTKGSMTFDDAGDFWAASQEPLPDRTAPTILAVIAHADPQQVTVLFSEPLEPRSAQNPANYGISEGVVVHAALLDPDGFTVRLATSALQAGVGYGLSVLDVTDVATPPNPVETGAYTEFSYSERTPLAVDAGADLRAVVGRDVLLYGSVAGEPAAGGSLDLQWRLVSGPGQAFFESPEKPTCFARFDAVGEYVLRLWADDGAMQASDDLLVSVEPEPSIVILRPEGTSILTAGSTVDIQWSNQSVYDVRIDFSADGGANWELLALTIDTTSSHWGSFPWVVPDISTERALLQLEEYSAVTSTLSQTFTIVAAPSPLGSFESPAPGAVLRAGKPTSIAFTPAATGTLDVEYSLNQGASWHAVASRLSAQAGQPVELPWIAPRARSEYGQLRLVDRASSEVAGVSQLFAIAPDRGDEPVEFMTVEVKACRPSATVSMSEVRANAAERSLDKSGCFIAEVPVPLGVDTAVFELQGHDDSRAYRRLVEVQL